MFRFICMILLSVLPALAGCVIVNPPDVHVSASPAPVYVGPPEPSDPQADYHFQMDRVLGQQAKVAKEIDRREWDEMLDETGDWMEYTRVFNTYADMSNNPKRFRQCCAQLLTRIEQLRSAGFRHDVAGCERALKACDPLLDQLSRHVPVAPHDIPRPRQSQAP